MHPNLHKAPGPVAFRRVVPDSRRTHDHYYSSLKLNVSRSQMAGGRLDPAAAERLPTAATCMNLLKLPPYPTSEQMRAKLLLAIQESAGFGLS